MWTINGKPELLINIHKLIWDTNTHRHTQNHCFVIDSMKCFFMQIVAGRLFQFRAIICLRNNGQLVEWDGETMTTPMQSNWTKSPFQICSETRFYLRTMYKHCNAALKWQSLKVSMVSMVSNTLFEWYFRLI